MEVKQIENFKIPNQKGIPSKRGGRWTATTIRGILTNEKYTGDVLLQNSFLFKQNPRMTMKMWLMKFTAFEN